MAGQDADKLWKQAEKAREASVWEMRLKPDWETATPLYERAANAYRQQKNFSKARQAAEKAALGHERQGSSWNAAKQLEVAGVYAKEAGDMANMASLYQRAGELYMEAGRGSSAAEALGKGARALEEKNPAEAHTLYVQAVQYLEDAGQPGQAQDIYRQAVGCLIRGQKYSDAARLLLKLAVNCEGQKQTFTQCKAYLGAVLVLLYGGNAKEAYSTYQDALGVDAFCTSKEAFAAEALLEAYRSGSADAVRQVVARDTIFTELDNQVAKLAKRLPQGSLQDMAAALGGAAPAALDKGDLDEDNLT